MINITIFSSLYSSVFIILPIVLSLFSEHWFNLCFCEYLNIQNINNPFIKLGHVTNYSLYECCKLDTTWKSKSHINLPVFQYFSLSGASRPIVLLHLWMNGMKCTLFCPDCITDAVPNTPCMSLGLILPVWAITELQE